jgi:hypothetical protein
MILNLTRRAIPKRFRPIGYIEHLVESRNNGRVAAGPFAGMRYIRGSVGSAYVPKLLGMYERELNEFVERACTLQLPLIVDVGAAEGYYAIGLGLRNPQASVIAFEMEKKGRDALAEMARLNSVQERVEIRGRCEVEDLRAALADIDRALVVCDCEGYEEVLLQPGLIPELARAYVLAEMHEFVSAGITDRILRRFSETHQVERIWQEPRQQSEFPYRTLGTMLLPRSYLNWAVSEWRPERMSWLWLEPRAIGNATA